MKHKRQGTKKKKVVTYCRVSTMEQKKKGYGIDIQIRDATLFAERRGLLVEKFYKDEGESGVKENRKALKQLLRDCKAGRVGVVVLPSLDRLSREVRIAENLFFEFKNRGVRVMIVDMPQYNGESKDILMRQILEAIAEDNRRGIIERLWKGRQERVRKGLFPGGNLPYGYVRKNKTVSVDQHEADIVRRIFAMADEKHTGQAIADELNKEGYARRNAKPWSQRQVCAILNHKSLYKEGALHYGEIHGKHSALNA
ncbi:MAG: recombinase family protein [Nitrospirae bacterium]|nr:recombinase family protein [Nitrospirota bacterium]